MFGIRDRLDRRRAMRARRAPTPPRGHLLVGQRVTAMSNADYYVVGTVSYVGLVAPDGIFVYHLAEYPAEAFSSDRIITPLKGRTV